MDKANNSLVHTHETSCGYIYHITRPTLYNYIYTVPVTIQVLLVITSVTNPNGGKRSRSKHLDIRYQIHITRQAVTAPYTYNILAQCTTDVTADSSLAKSIAYRIEDTDTATGARITHLGERETNDENTSCIPSLIMQEEISIV